MPNPEPATPIFESLCNDDSHGYRQIDGFRRRLE